MVRGGGKVVGAVSGFEFESVFTEGITRVTPMDIEYAEQFGYPGVEFGGLGPKAARKALDDLFG